MLPASIFDILARSALAAHVRQGSNNPISTRLYRKYFAGLELHVWSCMLNMARVGNGERQQGEGWLFARNVRPFIFFNPEQPLYTYSIDLVSLLGGAVMSFLATTSRTWPNVPIGCI